jgi:hypothetical protein
MSRSPYVSIQSLRAASPIPAIRPSSRCCCRKRIASLRGGIDFDAGAIGW